MGKDLENALAECLEALEEGRLTIKQCQELYPEEWEELRRLIPLASALRKAPPVTPSFNFRRSARPRLIAKLPPRRVPATIAWKLPRFSNLIKVPILPTIKPAMQLLAILVAITLLVTGVSTVYASDDALPGDTLYPFKIGIEKFHLLITFDEADQAQLQIEFAQRRIGEMKTLAEQGRYEDIQTAAKDYESLLESTNESLRKMVLTSHPRTAEIGSFVEEALFYDALILAGLRDFVPSDIQGTIDFAIGASKSGNAIARQWVELYSASPASAPTQLPATAQISESFGIPLPTDIACWPNDLEAEPPDGIPLCKEDQTPVPLPEDLVLFCWPSNIPFNPPQDVPLCKEGQAAIPLPKNLNLICWPREIPYDPPEELRLCEEGELPLSLPVGFSLPCWPSKIPYDAPDGIPSCESGFYPTPAPQELPCWPPELRSDPPPGLPLCEPGMFLTPPNGGSSLDGFGGGGGRDLLEDIRSQLVEQYCWPAWLEQKPLLGMPICHFE